MLAPFHNDLVASQIPIRHHDANSWVVKIGDKSLVGAAVRSISPAQAAYDALEACQTDSSTTISVTLCNIQDANREMPDIFEHLPYTEGEPGYSNFRVIYDKRTLDREVSFTKLDEALVALQKVRDTWDRHMSLIPSPSARLHACLDLFRENHSTLVGNYWDPNRCLLLFPGFGDVKDLIDFHISMNKMSIKGPPISRSLPNTQLGYWGGKYLSVYMEKAVQNTESNEPVLLRHIIQALTEVGANVEQFFESMEVYPEETVVRDDSVISTDIISVLSALKGCENHFESGLSIIECLKCYFRRHDEEGDICFNGLLGLIICLEQQKEYDKSSLRFSVGDRVECFMDGGEWLPGTILEQWPTDENSGFKQPYTIDL